MMATISLAPRLPDMPKHILKRLVNLGTRLAHYLNGEHVRVEPINCSGYSVQDSLTTIAELNLIPLFYAHDKLIQCEHTCHESVLIETVRN